MTDILIRNAEVHGAPGTDVRLSGGSVTAVGPGLPAEGADVIDANGGAVLPGLTDHHLHLHAMAADAVSVRCGPPDVRDAAGLADALAHAVADGHGWVRGVGYIETVAGELDYTALDRLHPQRPVRIQHRSGAMWVLNGAAVAAAGLAEAHHRGVERDASGAPTGRVWRADNWLRERLPASRPPALAPIGRSLARLGITSVTDATPDLHPDSLHAIVSAARSGELPQRVHLLGAPLAGESESTGRLTVGPYKIVLADSGLPDLTELADLIQRVHNTGRAVAVHCVSREALLILMAVFDDIGTIRGDRIEHGALIPSETLDEIHRLGLRVVTQPGFLAHRGDDYLRHVDTVDLPDLYRCRSLIDAGIPVALSSDAPYGPLDPWQVIAAAVERKAPTGEVVGRDERLRAAEALDAYLTPATDPGGRPRSIRPGTPADLVVMHTPLTEVLTDPSTAAVRLTLIDGSVVGPGS
ncbi:amidohydrolase family protein [Rhodococcus opacus]|uniref:amidohydrolase family protein n=1 Tax=Rhodococcus opacus TaxID=37919 RepID=UPI001C4910B8|nr:amidohydrolase family protein [Rhodococcus opacus]MBV6756149.1 amidohydrolase family protein [Rhodococcus opacus]